MHSRHQSTNYTIKLNLIHWWSQLARHSPWLPQRHPSEPSALIQLKQSTFSRTLPLNYPRIPHHILIPAFRAIRTSSLAFRPISAPSRRANRSLAVRVSASSADQVKQLNDKFGIAGHVEFIEGRGGLPTVVLKHTNGCSAEVVLFGGCITSWKQASGDEVLYIRPDAVFDKSKPISGGVPHCFPQFGPGKIQQHGFARNLDWDVAATSADPQPDDRDPEVQLTLTDNDYTRAMWPHAFKVAYSITLHNDLLRTDMRVVNTGDSDFDFTAALHTYFEVAGIEKAKVRGLKGLVRCRYALIDVHLLVDCHILRSIIHHYAGVLGQDCRC